MSAKTAEDLCQGCRAACCRYLATQIDTPAERRDYDHIRWYLLHAGVYVFIDHETLWYLEFETPCEELSADGRCRIYEARPDICRRHGEGEQLCEFVSNDEPHVRRFSTSAELEAYLDDQGIAWRPRAKVTEKKAKKARKR